MVEENITTTHLSKEDFFLALRNFDCAVCEALAVSQSVGVREAEAYMGWSTHIFARICVNATIMIGNIPGSRWGKRDYDFWDFSLVAPYTRALIESELLLFYLSRIPSSQAEWSAKINVMHMSDCMKRMEHFSPDPESDAAFEDQREMIAKRLNENEHFNALDAGTKKRCLSGKALTIKNRDEILDDMGVDRKQFKKIFDLLSHYTHVLPMSYYRMEANGRGTGCFNQVDYSYIYLAMEICTEVLTRCTDIITEMFPDTKKSMKGLKSKFSLGPKPRK